MDQLVKVEYHQAENCPLKDIQFSFFQIVYVISGKGSFIINNNIASFTKGSLILMTPDDQHSLNIEEKTELLLVKFSERYIKDYRWNSIDSIGCLLYGASYLSGCILQNKPDIVLVDSIIASLLHGIDHPDLYQEELTLHYVNALIVIAARNISKMRAENISSNSDKRIVEIINYIQGNIHDPALLKVSVISQKFGLSETYLGSYFKNHSGETITHYILNYKLRLIEHRLLFSDMRINEIVTEFGFSDESHLNKFFKKQHKISLTEFKKTKSAEKSIV
ncbi:AraC family transcriptional regulator [Chryseobacterium lactis]|uniref:AraC family transcriptional regulator n=1 Tax=Chryseobacterium lactis TaxID=1241981 RepID=A0A3G6RQC0_CHRLC|nr:AraC family transcriptional regulator [Chryseobacterium lactis]AZB07155.1 AraC family transcriptional regulator [Chryseobacterium lactis]PNW13280.1 AraC family transcriptional regulator [Chryseobacterium lactis]